MGKGEKAEVKGKRERGRRGSERRQRKRNKDNHHS